MRGSLENYPLVGLFQGVSVANRGTTTGFWIGSAAEADFLALGGTSKGGGTYPDVDVEAERSGAERSVDVGVDADASTSTPLLLRQESSGFNRDAVFSEQNQHVFAENQWLSPKGNSSLDCIYVAKVLFRGYFA